MGNGAALTTLVLAPILDSTEVNSEGARSRSPQPTTLRTYWPRSSAILSMTIAVDPPRI